MLSETWSVHDAERADKTSTATTFNNTIVVPPFLTDTSTGAFQLCLPLESGTSLEDHSWVLAGRESDQAKNIIVDCNASYHQSAVAMPCQQLQLCMYAWLVITLHSHRSGSLLVGKDVLSHVTRDVELQC